MKDILLEWRKYIIEAGDPTLPSMSTTTTAPSATTDTQPKADPAKQAEDEKKKVEAQKAIIDLQTAIKTIQDQANKLQVSLSEAEKKKAGDRCTRIAKRKYKVWPSAYACVPEHSSKALTKDGWKSVEQLSLNEEILTFNIEKDILEFKPIQKIHRYKDADTNVVKSGNTGFVFEATQNHKWVVKLPQITSERQNKYIRNHNDYSLIETNEILNNKHNKLLVVSAPYLEGNKTLKNKIYKYGDNWINYLLEATQEQRQAWLFSAIIYDGNQKKTERLTENDNHSNIEWLYDGNHGKQSFGFKQKDIMHRDAFLLSAFLNEGLVTWKKAKNKEIYSCNYTSNKRYKNTSNFKLVSQNITDVWCPQTENSTWVMMQETNGQGIITITGNSGAVVKCRQGKIWKGISESATDEEIDEALLLEEKDPKVGTGKKPKGSNRRLYTDENPKDTVSVKFSTVQDIKDTLSKESFKSKSHARQSQIINLIHQRVRVAYERAKDPEVKARLKKALDYAEERKEASKEKTKSLQEEQENNQLNERCWKGYTQKGMKTMFGKRYPNCVKVTKEEVEQSEEIDLALLLEESSQLLEKWSDTYKRSINCNNPKGFSQRAHCDGKKKNENTQIIFDDIEILEEETIDEAKKRDYKPNFSKEKEQGLHGWFARNKGKGWINCRTGGPCGRSSADKKGGKYPACRPTKAQCKAAGKGPLRKKKSSKPISWTKKKKKD